MMLAKIARHLSIELKDHQGIKMLFSSWCLHRLVINDSELHLAQSLQSNSLSWDCKAPHSAKQLASAHIPLNPVSFRLLILTLAIFLIGNCSCF